MNRAERRRREKEQQRENTKTPSKRRLKINDFEDNFGGGYQFGMTSVTGAFTRILEGDYGFTKEQIQEIMDKVMNEHPLD